MLFSFLWVALSALVGFLGRNRAFGFWGWFFYSLMVSPIFAFIIVLLASPKREGVP